MRAEIVIFGNRGQGGPSGLPQIAAEVTYEMMLCAEDAIEAVFAVAARREGGALGPLAEVKPPRAEAGGPGASGGCAAAPVPPGRAVVARVAAVKGRLVRPGGLLHGGRRGRFRLCLGGWRVRWPV